MKKMLFFINPNAGHSGIRTQLLSILQIFCSAGYDVRVYTTSGPREITRVIEAEGANYDIIVSSGGDGTLNETVAGLLRLEHPPLLGYIPAGTVNDVAASLGLPMDTLEAARNVVGGEPMDLDVGTLNGRAYAYVAAFGAFTKVAYETPQDLKNTFGHLAYVMAGIASLPSITPYHMKIEYDGNTLEADFYFGMVSNASSIGGIRLPSSEHVVLDDGLFEVDLVKKPVSLADVANGFQALLDQNQPSAGSRIHFKASHLTFTCEQPIPWTIDGEFGGSESVNEIVNCQRALTIIRGS